MYGFLGVHQIPYTASIILSLFTIIVITNSFNLIDGVDGLAGSLGLLTTLVFGIYFFYAGKSTYAVMAFALSGATIGFLLYNYSPAKIFMGDTGSLLLGLINSILVLKFIDVAGAAKSEFPLESAPAIGVAILMIPLFDTLRVFGLRILDRRSPFSPDRTHVHHFLLDLGFSHRMITLTCVTVNIGFIALAYFLRGMGTTTVLGILLLAAFVFIGIIYFSRAKTKAAMNERMANASIIKSHKILSLASEAVEAD